MLLVSVCHRCNSTSDRWWRWAFGTVMNRCVDCVLYSDGAGSARSDFVPVTMNGIRRAVALNGTVEMLADLKDEDYDVAKALTESKLGEILRTQTEVRPQLHRCSCSRQCGWLMYPLGRLSAIATASATSERSLVM